MHRWEYQHQDHPEDSVGVRGYHNRHRAVGVVDLVEMLIQELAWVVGVERYHLATQADIADRVKHQPVGELALLVTGEEMLQA